MTREKIDVMTREKYEHDTETRIVRSRSVALNIMNTIKMFNTTNRTSRFPTRDYCDTIGIYLRKFTRIIQNIIRNLLFIIIIF